MMNCIYCGGAIATGYEINTETGTAHKSCVDAVEDLRREAQAGCAEAEKLLGLVSMNDAELLAVFVLAQSVMNGTVATADAITNTCDRAKNRADVLLDDDTISPTAHENLTAAIEAIRAMLNDL